MRSYYGDVVRQDIKNGRKVFGRDIVLRIIDAYEKTLDDLDKCEESRDKYMSYYVKDAD